MKPKRDLLIGIHEALVLNEDAVGGRGTCRRCKRPTALGPMATQHWRTSKWRLRVVCNECATEDDRDWLFGVGGNDAG